MKHKRLKLCTMLLSAIGISGLHAQEAVPAAGGNASGSGGSASYSIGQVVYATNTGINGSEAQGIQQPFEISIVTVPAESPGINLLVSAYPNPATDYLTLKVENYDKEKLTYKLFDGNSKLIESKKITGNETSIVMSSLVPATYFLKVVQGSKEVKAFKITKN